MGWFLNMGRNKRIVIIVVLATIVVIGGVIGTIYAVAAYEQKQMKEIDEHIKRIEGKDETINGIIEAYKDRLNQIVNPLLVPDESGGNASIDNNNDLDSLLAAFTEINNLRKELESDTTLRPTEKSEIEKNIDEQIKSINTRAYNIYNERVQASKLADEQKKAEQEELEKKYREQQTKSHMNRYV